MAVKSASKSVPAKLLASTPVLPVPAVQPKAAAPVAAPVAAVTPAVVPNETITPVVKAEPQTEKGHMKMNDTLNQAQDAAKTFATDTAERATAMFGDMNGRAKDAMAKGSKAIEDLVEFSKGNLEAMVASGRVAAKGAQDIAQYSAEYGRKSIEDATATAKKFAAVKSPTEFFQLQSEVAKSSLDAMVGEASKFTENYLKLVGEVMQPVQNRVAVAVEKVKTTVAA